MIDSTYSPAPDGIVGMNVPLHDAGRIVEGQRRAHEDAEAHDAHQRLHHFLEAAVSAEQHEHEPEQAVETRRPTTAESVPCVRLQMPRPVALVNAAVTATVQSTRYTQKVALHPCRQVLGPPFERGFSRGELPTRDALVQNELEKRADRDRPEQHDAVARAANRRGDDVARADAGGRDDEPGACKLQKTE